jgi:drug/metabolite transporter (DMT)-like permease
MNTTLKSTIASPAPAKPDIAGGVARSEPAPSRDWPLIVMALLSVYVIWGSTYLAIKWGLEGGFPPFMMAGVRFLIAGGLMYGFLRLRGTPNPTRRQWLGMAPIGLLLLVGGNGGVSFAELYVSSSLAAVWIASMPLWAALFSGLFGRWPTWLEWIGLGVGLAGVVMLNGEGEFQANPIGAVALLFSTICWAFGSVWSTRLPMPGGPMSSAGEMLVGGAALSLLSFTTGERIPQSVTWGAVGSLVYLIIFGSIVAFSAYLFLLRRVRPTIATSYAYVNPVVAVALGVGLAGESLTTLGMVATLIILAAVALVATAKGRKST